MIAFEFCFWVRVTCSCIVVCEFFCVFGLQALEFGGF